MDSHADAPRADHAFEFVRLRGHVQGVGFRPAIARIATRLHLRGWVRNDADGVSIALGGEPAVRDRFLAALLDELPPLARVQQMQRTQPAELELPRSGFRILRGTADTDTLPSACVMPDAAVCAGCAAEVLDARAKRFRYPFTHCTQCGPRFSICVSLPWDRARTTMAGFELCAACQREHDDMAARRFHAEVIACPACGPTLCLSPETPEGSAIEAVAHALEDGAIVALKGLGGFNLLVDATNEDAV